MDGILLVDKPKGWTSHDVVAKVRKISWQKTGRKIKVGHTGTLDPAATGLLILVIGSYTRRAAKFSKLDKVYDCELTLGAVSTTGDADGQISYVSDKIPNKNQLKNTISQFIGTYKQIPPAYSAIKIKGQEAYKLARAGRELKMEPRVITIYKIENADYQYPKLNFRAKVSSGTYIRSLAQDIGAKLSTGAYLSALRRIKVGDFDVKDAYKLNDLNMAAVQTEVAKSP